MEAEGCKRELVIEIPVDVVRREAETVTAQYARVARIPGFRPGHAPASLVRSRFRDDIRSEVVQSLLPKFFENFVKDKKLSIVGQPRFEDLKFNEGEPLTCRATFEIYPEVELKEYKGLEVQEETPSVKEEEIDQALEKLRQRAATFEVIQDRLVADDDLVTVRYWGHDLKEPRNNPVEAREAVVHIGAKETVAAFSENLRGSKPGEVREFTAAYPEDYPQKTLAGKNYHYRVEVQNIKRQVLPPVDDELAKSVSEFKTLPELRDSLRRDLEKSHENRAQKQAKEKLMEQLLKAHEFPVPEFLVEAHLDRMLHDVLTQLLAQGIDPRNIPTDWRKLRQESRADAEKQVRSQMILERIADAEKIEIAEEEVDEVIREIARGRNEAPAALKTRLTEEGVLARIKSSRRNQKALNLIYQSAKIVRQNA